MPSYFYPFIDPFVPGALPGANAVMVRVYQAGDIPEHSAFSLKKFLEIGLRNAIQLRGGEEQGSKRVLAAPIGATPLQGAGRRRLTPKSSADQQQHPGQQNMSGPRAAPHIDVHVSRWLLPQRTRRVQCSNCYSIALFIARLHQTHCGSEAQVPLNQIESPPVVPEQINCCPNRAQNGRKEAF